MAYNLVIAYDLIRPGQNYEAVQTAIKNLGQWYQVQYSLFYVHSSLDADAAHDHVRAVMDPNDKLAVAEAKRLVMSPSITDDIEAINKVWFDNAA